MDGSQHQSIYTAAAAAYDTQPTQKKITERNTTIIKSNPALGLFLIIVLNCFNSVYY